MINEVYNTSKELFKDTKQAIAERIKLSAFVFYLIIFPIFNWDIFLFLFTEDVDTLGKIVYIRSSFGDSFLSRIGVPLVIAIISPLFFTWIQTEINALLSQLQIDEIKRVRDAEISAAQHRKKVNDEISGLQTTEQYQERISTLEALNQSHSEDKIQLVDQLKQKDDRIVGLEDNVNKLKTVLASTENSLEKSRQQITQAKSNNVPDHESVIDSFLERTKRLSNSIKNTDIEIHKFQILQIFRNILAGPDTINILHNFGNLEINLIQSINRVLVDSEIVEQLGNNMIRFTKGGKGCLKFYVDRANRGLDVFNLL